MRSGNQRSSSHLKPVVIVASHTGFAPLVPHFANLPLASLQCVGFTFAVVHLTNFPLASRHGAAMDGVDPAMMPTAAKAIMNLRISQSPCSLKPSENHSDRL